MNLKKALRLFAIAAVLSIVPTVAFAWRFASIADSRGRDHGVNTSVLAKIVDCINSEKVDLVIFEGDMVDAHNDEELAQQLDVWKSVMSKLNCPYYISAGNHDIPSLTSGDVIRAKFEMPANGPKGYEELVYSFDHKDAHFVCLFSCKREDGHRVQPAQRAWLRVDLALSKKPHVFVFVHDPAYPRGPHIGSSLDKYPDERDALWRLLATHNCRAYFCGHEHLYARDEKDGVVQIINGTCGVSPSKGVPGTVTRYHYVIVDVEGSEVRGAAKDVNGAEFDSWSYPTAR